MDNDAGVSVRLSTSLLSARYQALISYVSALTAAKYYSTLQKTL